jgi:hypothetical protein
MVGGGDRVSVSAVLVFSIFDIGKVLYVALQHLGNLSVPNRLPKSLR